MEDAIRAFCSRDVLLDTFAAPESGLILWAPKHKSLNRVVELGHPRQNTIWNATGQSSFLSGRLQRHPKVSDDRARASICFGQFPQVKSNAGANLEITRANWLDDDGMECVRG